MYMNTASNVDRAIGDILERVLVAVGREPGVIVLSDHGESLFDEGFLLRGELRRDWSDVPFFVGSDPSSPQKGQTTVLVGMVWWIGGKKGAW